MNIPKLPWTRMIGKGTNHFPTVRPTFDEATKRVRNRLRRYRADSIVVCALSRLHKGASRDVMEDLKSWPWLSLLLVKLVLGEPSIPLDRGEVCPPDAFDYCLQTLWDAQGSRDRMGGGDGRLHLMMRSLIQPQLIFQLPYTVDFLRWPALIARLPADDPCRALFIDRFGMEPEAFNLVSYAMHTPVLNDELRLGTGYFSPLKESLGDAAEVFLAEFSRDVASLREELQGQRQARLAAGQLQRPHHELNEPPWLMKYPLLRNGNGELIVWHPAIFTRGMNEGVHWRLSESGGEYASQFSRVFETYVVELIAEAGLEYLSEADYKNVLGSDSNTMEAIVTLGDVNVFVEAKLTLYNSDMAQHTHAPVVWKALRRVRDAMNQGWKVSERLRQPGLPDWDCTRPREDILVVVTSQSAFCATGEHFRRLFKHDVFDPEKLAERKQKTPNAAQLATLPLENIVIASITEWEHLMGCVGRGEIELVPFLRDAIAANKDPVKSVMFIDQLLGQRTTTWAPSKLIETARSEVELALIRALGGTEADLRD